jgi:hypothetical protein
VEVLTDERGRPQHAPEPKIDPEFKNIPPPLKAEEYEGLEQLLLAERGCRDPLVVWHGHGILLDGHNRLEICQKQGLPYTVVERHFDSREQALNWIIATQLARRNLTPQQASALRGKRYNLEKHDDHARPKNNNARRDAISDAEPGAQNAHPVSTAARLGEEYGVDAATIRRDAKYDAAVEAIAATQGPEVKQKLLAGEYRLGKRHVIQLATLPKVEQAKILGNGPMARAAIVRRTRRLKAKQKEVRERTPHQAAAEEAISTLASLISSLASAKRPTRGESDAIKHFKTARRLAHLGLKALRCDARRRAIHGTS